MTASEIDHIINHLSLKKSRRRWRWIAIALAALALILLLARGGGDAPRGDHVARLSVSGLITGDDKQLKLLAEMAKDDAAKAVIIRIDSPGGTTAGSEAVYEAIRKLAAKKPVVAVMDTVAASGGYITAIAADHIVARGNTITGSVGVIFTYPEVSGLLGTLGVRMEELKSGDVKAEPSPYRPASDKAKQLALAMVMDGFEWFKGLVAERRKLTPERLAEISDGRVYSGRQALAAGLIDEIGGEDEALAWLVKDKKLPDTLDVIEWHPPKPWLEQAMGASLPSIILKSLGLEPLQQAAQTVSEQAQLDGLLALWHPSLTPTAE